MTDLIKELKEHKCEAVLIKGHWRIFKDGTCIATMASTPGDRRSLLNAKAEMRKLGIRLKRK